MAVAFGGTKTTSPATGTTITSGSWSISGSNLAILVYIANSGGSGEEVSSVSWSLGSGTAYRVGEILSGGITLAQIWAIPAPSAGSGTYTVNFSASTPFQVSADYFTGADQTTPCPIADIATASGVTNPLSATPANLTASDAAAGCGANVLAGDNPQFQQTQTYADNTTNTNMAAGYHLGTGAVSVLWGTPNLIDGFIAVRIAAAAGGGGGVFNPYFYQQHIASQR